MYTLTAYRGFNTFRFHGNLDTLIVQAGEYDGGTITAPDGVVVYSVEFTPMLLARQAS